MIYLGSVLIEETLKETEAVEEKSIVNEPLQRPGWDSEGKEGDETKVTLMTRKTLFFFFLVALSDVNVLPHSSLELEWSDLR